MSMIMHSLHFIYIMHTSCFFTGSDEYEKLVANLSKTSLLNGIKNASPIAQTSCLEGYHSVVNQFAPKMLAYSHTGILCRSVITHAVIVLTIS
jgi:hypothetical protein